MSNGRRRDLRSLWDDREVTVGGWCAIPSPFAAELMGSSGFDWCCIDMQHGLAGHDTSVAMLQALDAVGMPAFIRVSWNSPPEIMRALDAGASGVIVPMIDTRDGAKAAVAACRYPPSGIRSWGPTRAAIHAGDLAVDAVDRSVICAVMVETIVAVQNIDSIVAVPGVDAVFVGPNDLAVSMGIDPSRSHGDAEYNRAIERVLRTCQRIGVVPGIYCGSLASALRWRKLGFKMIATQSDARLLRDAASKLVRAIREEAVLESAEVDEGSPAGYT